MYNVNLGGSTHPGKLAPMRSVSGLVESHPEPVASLDQVAVGVKEAVGITASRLRADGELRRELLQEAWVAALELTPAFDRSRGISFIDYLRSHLRWRLRTYLRQERRRSRSIGPMPMENVRFGSRRFDPSTMRGPDLRSAIRRLSPRQRSVIAAKYVGGSADQGDCRLSRNQPAIGRQTPSPGPRSASGSSR